MTAPNATPASAVWASPNDVLGFWLGSARPGDASALQHAPQWFTKSDAFDAELTRRFEPTVQAALAGQLDDWAQDAWGRLALIVLLDQFTRNIYRGTPQSFAGDDKALQLALDAIALGHDKALPAVTRIFVYLPLEHAENPAYQARSVQLFTELALQATPETLAFFTNTKDYAHKHQAVIARFGRFPHRNPILQRCSTAQELDYLAQPGAGF